MDQKYPHVGVGVMIMDERGQVLLGLRQGSHGAGEWSFPGGHLEFGETLFETAVREAAEETGLLISDLELVSVADERRYLATDGKHYVNIGLKAGRFSGQPQVKEPAKCREWRWFPLDDLPQPLFEGTALSIRNYQAKRIYQP
ncbi:MAG: NUDIX domain-containing protein [Patescibacteria group bacterium]